MEIYGTLRAMKSLSRLWPIKMVRSLNMLRRAAWTSRSVVLTPCICCFVMPLNLVLQSTTLCPGRTRVS